MCPAAKKNTQVVQGFSFKQQEIKVDVRHHGSSPFLSTSLTVRLKKFRHHYDTCVCLIVFFSVCEHLHGPLIWEDL